MNDIKPKVLGGIGEKKSNGGKQWYQQDRIYDDNIAISVTTAFNPYYLIRQDNIPIIKKGNNMNEDKKINVIGNYSPSGYDASRIVDNQGIAPTVKENHGTVTATINNLRIRKLTPKECWRLMGFDDEDFEKASKVNSNTQLYKQAGNSIVVNVLEAILKNLLLEGEKEISRGQTTIYDFI
jgi:site-specific DNA-cytosine methylase